MIDGRPSRWRRSELIVLGGIVAAFLLHVAWFWTIQEDAFIGYRYVRHLVEGHGLRWNIGEPPVEGYTDFLWLILLSGFMRLGAEVPLSAQLLGTMFGAATVVLTAAAARALYPPPGRVWLLPPALLALSGCFAAWAPSGMETSMFAFLVLAGFVLYVVERSGESRWPWSAVVLALAAMTRPEGVLVFVVTLAHRVWWHGRGEARAHLAWLLAFAVPFGLYFAWRYHYYGFLLPNTFYAKVGTTPDQVVRGVKYVGKFFIVMGVPLLALPAFVLGRRSFVLSYAAALSAFYIVYVALVGGDYMAYFRFLVPVLPFLCLALPLTLVAARRRWPRSAPARAAAVALLVVATLIPSANLEALPRDPPPSGPFLRAHHLPDSWYMKMRHVTAFPRLISERWYVNRFALLGTWLERHLPREASFAYYAMGVIGWTCDRAMLDMYGVNDVYIAHKTVATMGRGVAGHDKRDFLYVLRREPTYILLSRHFRTAPVGAGQLEEVYRHELASLGPAERRLAARYLARYVPDNVWLTDTANREAGYAIFLRLTACSTDEGCRRCRACLRGPAPEAEGGG